MKHGINLPAPQQQHQTNPNNAQPDPWQPVIPVDPNPNPKKITPPPPAPQDPNVLEALKPIFRLAQASNKKVFVMLSMDGCAYCEKMKRDVFPNTNMSAYAYLETKDRIVVDHYRVTAFPTFIIFDNTGRELKRHTGYMSVQQLKQWIQ